MIDLNDLHSEFGLPQDCEVFLWESEVHRVNIPVVIWRNKQFELF